jgi:mediator of RNA polymerase II transcription subunit 22
MAESDVSRPSALPTANLRLRGAQTLSQPTNAGIENEHDSEAYLDAFEEDWNKRIDSEMDVLVEGMTDLVSLAQVCYINSLVLISLCLGSCIMHHTRLATRTSSA